MSRNDLVFLTPLRRFEDLTLLLLRLLVGSFLIYGVWDNIAEPARMEEFVGFLRTHGFAAPELMAPLSVYAQFAVGLAFVFGFLTRWAGLVCAFNFVVAVVMVDAAQGIRGAFPAAVLVFIGLYLAARGSGRLGMDALLERREPAPAFVRRSPA